MATRYRSFIYGACLTLAAYTRKPPTTPTGKAPGDKDCTEESSVPPQGKDHHQRQHGAHATTAAAFAAAAAASASAPASAVTGTAAAEAADFFPRVTDGRGSHAHPGPEEHRTSPSSPQPTTSLLPSPISYYLGGLLKSVEFGKVAYADAAVPAPALSTEAATVLVAGSASAADKAGKGTVSPSSTDDNEGEKPEFIRRADEQAELMKNQLRQPSQFPDQFGEASRITRVHSFEGFRLTTAKSVTPTFSVSHNLIFGNPQVPSDLYQGTLTMFADANSMIRVTMDHEGNAITDIFAPLGLPRLSGKLHVQQGKAEAIQGIASYAGDTFVGQLSAATGSLEVSYNQAVTQELSIGGQGQFSPSQQAAALMYGFKYNTPSWAALGQFVGSANVVTMQYLKRVVPGRFTLAAEYQAQLGEGSQAMIGAEFVLRQSTISTSLDSNGKVDSILEVKLGTFPTLPVTFILSSSLEHAESKYNFGVGLTLGN